MTPGAIDGDPDELSSVTAEFREHMIVECHLVTTPRAPVRWVESEDDRLPNEVAERQILVRGNAQFEAWRCSPRNQNAGHSLVSRRFKGAPVGSRSGQILDNRLRQPPWDGYFAKGLHRLDGGQDSPVLFSVPASRAGSVVLTSTS